MKMTIRLALPSAVGAVLLGCSSPPPPPPANPVPAVSFDGRYSGSVRVDSAAVGFTVQQCASDPQVSLQVTNNRFVFIQRHPNLIDEAAGLPASATTETFDGFVTPDGIMAGSTGNGQARIAGHVTGSRMSGQINGMLCTYTFTAQRV